MNIKKFDYIENYPDLLIKEIVKNPIGYLPLGAMEWHSYHLPLGFDGLVCEYFFRELARKKGGVVFPTVHYGIAENLPHPASFVISDNVFKKLLKNIIEGMISLGIKVIIAGTGHWSINQIKYLLDLSSEINAKYTCDRILMSGLPLGIVCLEEGINIDHAGVYETSLGMALFPDKVKCKRLGDKYLGEWNFPDALQLAEFGIECKKDPRQNSKKEYGDIIVQSMLTHYSCLIGEMLSGQRVLLNRYHTVAKEFLKGNFSELYGNIDPVRFYNKVKKILKNKKY